MISMATSGVERFSFPPCRKASVEACMHNKLSNLKQIYKHKENVKVPNISKS